MVTIMTAAVTVQVAALRMVGPRCMDAANALNGMNTAAKIHRAAVRRCMRQ